jgi:hypothetical protein
MCTQHAADARAPCVLCQSAALSGLEAEHLAQVAAHRERVVDPFGHRLPDTLLEVEGVDCVEVLQLVPPAEDKELAAAPTSGTCQRCSIVPY